MVGNYESQRFCACLKSTSRFDSVLDSLRFRFGSALETDRDCLDFHARPDFESARGESVRSLRCVRSARCAARSPEKTWIVALHEIRRADTKQIGKAAMDDAASVLTSGPEFRLGGAMRYRGAEAGDGGATKGVE
jgi:hypothetical protein